MYNAGAMFLNGDVVAKDSKMAMKLFKEATEAGEPVAMYAIWVMYLEGDGDTKDSRWL